jgi:hypothetical protein
MASKADDERRAFALSSGLGRNALVFSNDDLVHLLRAAIEREGSQIAFAKHYGVNRTYLNMILSGKNLLATQLQRLLGFTKCTSLGNGEMHATTTGKPSLTSISRMSQDSDQRGLSCSRKMRRGGLRPT